MSYKRLGDYIKLLDERNAGLHITNLIGVSISKKFIKSVANVIGTDMENYKIIRKNQFACSIMQVRRDRKMPVALYTKDSPSLISQAYPVFEIINPEALLPEYLMMWFTRSEFDREACFHAVGGVRGSLEWEDFCNMSLPIPSSEKQLEIVRECNVIQNRIKLNNQLIAKLEETAQAIYKQWFVDFEFPNENGLPYKSNGGQMVDSDLGEIPKEWMVGNIGDLSNQFSGYSFKGEDYSLENGIDVLRGENVTEGNLRWDTHKKWQHELNPRIKKCFLEENDIVIGMDGSKVGKNWALISSYDLPLLLAQRVTCLRGKSRFETTYIYLSMIVRNFYDYVTQVQTGTSVPHISGDQIKNFPLLKPSENIIPAFGTKINAIFDKISLCKQNLNKLKEMNTLLLSKMTKIETEKEFA